MNDGLECSDEEFFLLGSEVAQSGASLRFEVRGWSMYPLIRDRDVLEVAPISLSEVAIGDTVFYKSGSRLIAHRVVDCGVGAHGPYLKARGDSFRQVDPLVTESDFVGKVQRVFRPRRGAYRAIPQDSGAARWVGLLVARSTVAHRLMRWCSLLVRRARRLIR